jgi:hypothetical protein
MRRPILALSTTFLALGLVAGPPVQAHNEGLPSIPLAQRNLEHVANLPNLSGNALDFFARRAADGAIRWYAVASNQGNGFDIVDITDTTHPTTVGRYLLPPADRPTEGSAGFNSHPWVSVNPRRNIVALTVEEQPAPSATTRHLDTGIQFVDISDVTNPVALGKIDGLGGPHTVRMIGDNHVYTTMPTHIVDYTDPMRPTSVQAPPAVQGHEFWQDPNDPTLGYFGQAASTARWGLLDLSNPASPTVTRIVSILGAESAHEVFPSPDGTYVGVAELKAGPFELACPGGAVHFYDISGKYVPGASRSNPLKMGQWFAPFTGTAEVSVPVINERVNHASCTMHSWHMQTERELGLGGLYAGGIWVFDPSRATQAGGAYTEYDGPNGKTTWGTTLANFRDAADYVNSSQWLPFDTETPAAIQGGHDRLIFVNGSVRGVDVYRYTGPMPKKVARLTVSGAAPGGIVAGKLDRYGVLMPDGYRNLPLAGKTLQVTVDEQTVEVETAGDGSFEAALTLAPGSHTVTVSWAGDDRFEARSVTRQISVS